MPKETKKNQETIKKRDWHSAFRGATEWELNKNKDDLFFDPEHILGKRPIKMDMLIIKKKKEAVIENEIGKIFREHNIVEFKGDGDRLNIDVYYKTLAYACLYKGTGKHVNEIPAEEITVTMMRSAYPRELFDKLKEMGLQVNEKYEGIYYIEGNVLFPTQIIVTKDLNSKHSSLRVLTRNAMEEDVISFLKEAGLAREPGEQENINAVLHVSIDANRELYRKVKEEKNMYDALKDLMADYIEEEKEKTRKDTEEKDRKLMVKVIEEEKEKTRKQEEKYRQDKVLSIRNIMKTLEYTAKQAMDLLMIPEKERSKYMTML